MKSIYAIVFKDTQEILTPDSFTEYWRNYGGNNLYGWRAPKKLYFTIGRARGGFAHIPEELKSKVAIARFDFAEVEQDGEELREKQKITRAKKEEKVKERQAKYRLECAERNLTKALEDIKKLNLKGKILIK